MSIACTFPLVETKRNAYFKFNDTSCGVYCGNGEEILLLYTPNEISKLNFILLVLSVATICLAPLHLCTAIFGKQRSDKSFTSLPFAYQSPFFISIGYLIIAFIILSPFLFGGDSIICNKGENTLTMNSLYNPACTITGLGLFVGIRLVVFYTCALSVSLVLTLYNPKSKQRKCWFHIPILGLIGVSSIPIISSKSINGNFTLRFCVYSLNSRRHVLDLDIIPLASCVFIFLMCLSMATFKLFHQNWHVFNMLSVNKDIRSLFTRLVLYNILQIIAIAAVVVNFCYWYANMDAWYDTELDNILCEMGKNSTEEWELCITNNHNNKPPLWSWYLFPLCALVSIIGAIIFQCSLKVRERSVNSMKMVVVTFMSSVRTTCSRRKPERPITFYEFFPGEPELDRITTDRSESTILDRVESLDSAGVELRFTPRQSKM